MSRVLLPGKPLRGTVAAPPSKSAAHRALICAALSGGESVLSPFILSDDMRATIGGLRAMGAEIEVQGDTARVCGAGMFRRGHAEIDCMESGSTVRFLIPLSAAGGVSACFTGSGRLPERPLDLFGAVLPGMGADVSGTRLPLCLSGKLRPGVYELPGNISSQYISGFLMALPLLPGDSEIVLTTPLESARYVDMTVSTMADFGVHAARTEKGWKIPGAQAYRAADYRIEGDWSQAAFFLAAGAMGGDVTVTNLRRDSLQGDREIEALLRRFGAVLEWTENGLRARAAPLAGAAPLSGIEIDASQIPDLVPVLAAVGAVARGSTRIHSAARVRLKESDRLETSARALGRLGIHTAQDADSLTVSGGSPRGGEVDGANDHRVVMAFSVLGSVTPGIAVTGARAVNKSYPAFFDEYNRLGGGAVLAEA